MATLIEKLIPRTFVERALAVLVALFLAGIFASWFETRYFWSGRDCIKSAMVGRYAVAPKFCTDADAEKAAQRQRLRDLGL
jgi:hypothetical protein